MAVLRIFQTPVRSSVLYGGVLGINGTITEFLVPGSYNVRLYDQENGRLIKSTWSDVAGHYAFTHLNTRKMYVIAFDHTTPLQNAVILDKVVPS